MAIEAAVGDLGRRALNKAAWRLLPLIGLGYGVAYMDRANISFAALRMNADLHFSATVYGLGAGLFFLSYAALEVPSNLMLIRFGARRWIARIMLTWGLLAIGMLFVRTPVQFYAMRFLLGAAEAGFFPGVIFYLTQWFPAEQRGRAISRFYIAWPLSTVVMGALAGTLLGLQGRLGLAGWQWLFLLEGLPAIVLSVVFLIALPDGPQDASWLTEEERGWILARIAADQAAYGCDDHDGLIRTLTDRRVLILGLSSLCIIGTGYAFNLSAPAVLEGATHLGVARVGYLMALSGVLGAIAMVWNASHSDRRQERRWHVAIPLALTAVAYPAMGLSGDPRVVILAFVITAIGSYAVQAVFWSIPGEMLKGRSAGVGVAAIGSISMFGAFIGPWAWGVARDQTGGYRLGLVCLAVPLLIAAAIVVLGARRRASSAALEASLAGTS
ncbi:MAG TPA: MFS transporter [Caulobacteraceae bacterium]|jgi:ACS family tartrate transporter-like MFS transporter|nr:MFS transporter [Caulobacteraceae bacterium]